MDKPPLAPETAGRGESCNAGGGAKLSWQRLACCRSHESRVELLIPANAPNQMYTLTMKAHSASGIPVGTLMTHGLRRKSWHYRFRIMGSKSKPRPSSDH